MIIVDRWYFSFDVDLSLISLSAVDFLCISIAAKLNIDSDGQLFGSLFVRFLWFWIWTVFHHERYVFFYVTNKINATNNKLLLEEKRAINDNLIHQFCSNYASQCSASVSSAWAFDIIYRSLTDIIILHLLKCIQLMLASYEVFFLKCILIAIWKEMKYSECEETKRNTISSQQRARWLLILNLNNVAK